MGPATPPALYPSGTSLPSKDTPGNIAQNKQGSETANRTRRTASQATRRPGCSAVGTAQPAPSAVAENDFYLMPTPKLAEGHPGPRHKGTYIHGLARASATPWRIPWKQVPLRRGPRATGRGAAFPPALLSVCGKPVLPRAPGRRTHHVLHADADLPVAVEGPVEAHDVRRVALVQHLQLADDLVPDGRLDLQVDQLQGGGERVQEQAARPAGERAALALGPRGAHSSTEPNSNPPLGTCLPRRMKTHVPARTCTHVFTAAGFTTAITWMRPKCPSSAQWTHTTWPVHTPGHHSTAKGGDALTLAVWTGPEHMMLGDRSHMPGLPST